MNKMGSFGRVRGRVPKHYAAKIKVLIHTKNEAAGVYPKKKKKINPKRVFTFTFNRVNTYIKE